MKRGPRPAHWAGLGLLAVMTAAAGEVERVHNGAAPRDGRQTIRLKEAWRIGAEDEGLIFGRIPRVLTDPRGIIYIFDAQLCHVQVFSPDGRHLRTLFREGDGPAEVRGPRDMLLMPDGRVGLVLEGEGVVAFVHADGTPAGRFSLSGPEGGIFALVSGAGTGQHVILAGTRTRPGEIREIRRRENFLVTFDLTGTPHARLAESHGTRDFRDFRIEERTAMPSFLWAFAPRADGTVYVAPDRDRYFIQVFGPIGDLRMTIERAYDPLMRSAEESEAFYDLIATSNASLPIPFTIAIEKSHPAIVYLQRGLQPRADGTLWVLSGRGTRPTQPGVMAAFDVFDAEGIFTRQVTLLAPHDGQRVGIVLSDAEQVIVIKGYLESIAAQFGNGATFSETEGKWDAPEIICYEMEPEG